MILPTCVLLMSESKANQIENIFFGVIRTTAKQNVYKIHKIEINFESEILGSKKKTQNPS